MSGATATMEAPATRLRAFPMPGSDISGGSGQPPGYHETELPYPPIEALESFVRRVDSSSLSFGNRHYNGSIARHAGKIYMAYRVESFRAVSSVGLCEMDEGFNVLRDRLLEPPSLEPSLQLEDPHMASVGGELVCFTGAFVRDFPQSCRQRLFTLDPQSLSILSETPVSYGRNAEPGGVEKNWTPFELPDGRLGMVYRQKPRTLARLADMEGWITQDAALAPAESSLSGRTGPLRISPGLYLEFVGGHVRIPGRASRGTRYWFGALVFEAKPPFSVLGSTREPLVWASEASPTIRSPLNGAGHPVCILPEGAMLDGHSVLVSCGVNDSYIAILRFNVEELLARMTGGVAAIFHEGRI